MFCSTLIQRSRSNATGHHSGDHRKLRSIGLKELPELRSGLLLDPYAAPLSLFAMSYARNLDAGPASDPHSDPSSNPILTG